MNFRCFKDYTVKFNKFNILVGKNNSGKSTIIDALKLISNVIRYSPYRDSYLKDKDIPFSLANIRYNYIQKDAIVFSKFSDGTEIEVIFPVEGKPYTNLIRDGRVTTDVHLRNKMLGIVPPVGTFEDEEELSKSDYVRSIVISHLMPRHFRNIWYYFEDGFDEFKDLIEITWPGYTIEPPEVYHTKDFEYSIEMYFREGGAHREIFWAGHGFQIWLQLMTFLVKLGKIETLVVDEPDIYLHQDVQKKFVNICKNRASQIIIATHAVDIIEEVEHEDIISIDSSTSKADRLSTLDDVQRCVTQLGSTQNLKLVNFIKRRTCLFIEGKEIIYLKKIAAKINIDRFVMEDGFAHIPLEGFSNWDRLLHVNWIFTNVLGEKVKCYVLLDRDYYPQNKINEVYSTLTEKGVKVHIWERKEIENYIINFDILYRLFIIRYHERYGNVEIPIKKEQFDNKLSLIMDELKEDVQSQLMSRLVKYRPDRSMDETNVMCQFLKEFSELWTDINYRKKVIPGKQFFSSLNDWLNTDYHISLSIKYIFNSLLKEEIDDELASTLIDFMKLLDS